MPRRPREDWEGGLYHLIARGNDRQKIFRDLEDFRYYLSKIRFYAKKFSVTFYACCLMPNHVHFLVRRGASPLSKFMQGLQQSYTFYVHRKYKRVGHLFQGRYKAILCEKDAYFLELVRYIHLNPIRAGIASRLNDYLWSSHQGFRGTKGWEFINTKTVLEEVGGIRNYIRFMNDGIKEGYREDLHEIKEQLYLGSDQFIERSESKVHSPSSPRWNISLAELAYEVEKYRNLPFGSLQSPSRSRALTPGRNWLLYFNHSLARYPLREIAQFLRRDPSRLSRQWNQFLARYHERKELRSEAERLVTKMKRRLTLYPRRTK